MIQGNLTLCWILRLSLLYQILRTIVWHISRKFTFVLNLKQETCLWTEFEETLVGIILEGGHDVFVEPAAQPLQCLRQIPVVQRDHGLYAVGTKLIDDTVRKQKNWVSGHNAMVWSTGLVKPVLSQTGKAREEEAAKEVRGYLTSRTGRVWKWVTLWDEQMKERKCGVWLWDRVPQRSIKCDSQVIDRFIDRVSISPLRCPNG